MPKVTVTITHEELKQLVAKQLNLTSDTELVVVVESCEGKPIQEGWITWNGGERPVNGKTRVEIELRNGERWSGTAGNRWRWSHSDSDAFLQYDIVAYRVVKE